MKFAQEDKEYFERREAFSKKTGARELWSVIDQWPLYCGIANLGRYLAISDILRETLDVPGDIAEFLHFCLFPPKLRVVGIPFFFFL